MFTNFWINKKSPCVILKTDLNWSCSTSIVISWTILHFRLVMLLSAINRYVFFFRSGIDIKLWTNVNVLMHNFLFTQIPLCVRGKIIENVCKKKWNKWKKLCIWVLSLYRHQKCSWVILHVQIVGFILMKNVNVFFRIVF
jgi:hypothetical protein